MHIIRSLAGLFLMAGFLAHQASAAELKVLSADASRPALQELAPAFEKASGHKLKIDYAAAGDVQKKVADDEEYDVVILDQPAAQKLTSAAKIVSGTTKVLFQGAPDVVYIGSTLSQTEQPIPAKALVDFLAGANAKDIYKAKGLQPG